MMLTSNSGDVDHSWKLLLLMTFRQYWVISQPKVETISAADAGNYIGKKEVVCSEVYEVKELSCVSFLDLGANYPDNPLTIVVFARDLGKFTSGLEISDHKNICVTGTIQEYKGKPEIIITSPQEITVQ